MDLKQLPEGVGATLDMIMRQKTTESIEMATLYMMNRYSFDFDHLRRVIESRSLDVSFSRVGFSQVAPFVGLNPDSYLADTPLFGVYRARFTEGLFADINEDMCVAIDNYGAPIDHENVEARSRSLAPLFTRTVAQFNSLIKNSPGSIIEGQTTRKGRIVHTFRAFGCVYLLFIEVKYQHASGKEYYDAVAQVIAEANACRCINASKNLPGPIYGILCDGESFQFFCFDHGVTPKVSMGCFPFLGKGFQHDQKLRIVDLVSSSFIAFMTSVRAVGEAIFYVLLRGYTNALQAYYKQSVEMATGPGTPPCLTSIGHAEDALRMATEAADLHAAGKVQEARRTAELASKALQESVDFAPPNFGRREYSQLYRMAMKEAEMKC